MAIIKQIKTIIPSSIKHLAWYIFKSPQRKLHPFSLANDVKGIIVYGYKKLFPPVKLQPISICTGLYNRSSNYLTHVIQSINQAQHSHLIELSVFDCASTDIPNLEQQIRLEWKGKLQFFSEPIPFSRAATFNKAVQNATSSIVFLCDADISLPPAIVTLCNAYVAKKTVWFPIVFFLFKDKPIQANNHNGVWEQQSGHGMVGMLKSNYSKIGGLNEEFTTWGGEDNDLWERCYKNGFCIIRNKQIGLFHHWHTSLNPKYNTYI